MDLKAVKILAFDLDYTLLDSSKQVGARTREALKRAAERGYKLVFATGRGLSTVPGYVLAIEGFSYIVSANGARVTDLAAGRTVHAELMSEADIAPALRYLEDPDVMREVFFDNRVCADRRCLEDLPRYGVTDPANQNYIRTTREPVEDTIALIHENFGRLESVNIFMADLDMLARWLKELRAIPGINAVTSFKNSIEVGSARASKGKGLTALAASFGWGPDAVMAFGDSNNDLSMIQDAGVGVAMGNASDEIKAAADFITLGCDEDGIAHALETLLGI